MAYPLTFVPLLSLTADPLGGVLIWGSAGLASAVLAAALLGIALNALHRAAAHDHRPHTRSNPPADRNFRQAA